MVYLAILLFFVSLSMIFSLLLGIFFPAKTALAEALDVYEEAWIKRYGPLSKATNGRQRIWHFLLALAKWIGFREFIQERLDRGGVQAEASQFVVFHLTIMLAAGFFGLLIFDSWAASIIFILIAGFLPLTALDYLKSKREKLFYQQLPETLLLVAGSLKAGYSFLQAVDTIVKETTPPMSVEFKKVLTESRLGLSVEQALEKMAMNVNNTTFNWVAMAVKIQREVGGNLAEVLEILAAAIRERDQVDREVRALTAEGRLSALILFCLPFLLGGVLFFLNRGYISLLFTNAAGLFMSGAALLLMGTGALWLRKIVRIEV